MLNLYHNCLKLNLSAVGSNHHRCESLMLSYWNDYLLDVEESAGAGVTFNDILFFASGCNVISPFGMKLFLEFLHQPEKNGKLSNYPKANTCILYLPVTHSSYNKFKEDLSFAFLNTHGFGEP